MNTWSALAVVLLIVAVATADALAEPVNVPIESCSMGRGWPFNSLMQRECDKSREQAKQIGFVCQFVKGNKYLYFYMGKFFDDDSDEQKETNHRIDQAIAMFALAGGRDILFVDISGPDQKASRMRHCRLDKKWPTCTVWHDPGPTLWKHYGLADMR